MTAHSKVGASSSNRWMNCPGSVNKISSLPFKVPANPASIEGTRAHKLGDDGVKALLKSGQFCDPRQFIGEERVDEETGEVYEISEDMAEAVFIYVEYAYDHALVGSTLHSEIQFELSDLAEGMFGTCDLAIFHDFLGSLEIVDYKHGIRHIVDPENNKQLKFYALGAIRKLNIPKNTSVTLTIVQPRAFGEKIKSWKTTIEDLEIFGEELKKAALLTQSPDAPLIAGEHCDFCPANGAFFKDPFNPAVFKAHCEPSKKMALAAAFSPDIQKPVMKPVQDLSINELKYVLDNGDILTSWLKNVEKYALEMADRGVEIPGYKLVDRLSNRKWKDEEDAKKQLKEGFKTLSVMTEPKLKSPAQIEALKISKAFVSMLTVRTNIGSALVPLEDKRQAVMPKFSPNVLFGDKQTKL